MSRLDTLLELYLETFGQSYPLMIMDERNTEEIILDIKQCIENGKPAKAPYYEPDCDY